MFQVLAAASYPPLWDWSTRTCILTSTGRQGPDLTGRWERGHLQEGVGPLQAQRDERDLPSRLGDWAREEPEPSLFQAPLHWGLLSTFCPMSSLWLQVPIQLAAFHLWLPGLGVITWPCIWLT